MQGCVNDNEPVGADLQVGSSLPAFEVELNDGSSVSARSLRGKAAVIVFFNTGCPDCQAELSVVNKFYENFKDDPKVEIFAVAREEEPEPIETYWRENHLSIPWSAQPDRKIYNLFATSRIPRIYFADTEGMITAVFTDINMPDYEQLEQALILTLQENR